MFPSFTPDYLAFVAMQYFCLLFSLCVHEAAHAAMGNWCGDPTARLLGRLTLDPRKHIDPLGTVVFPLLGMLSGIPFLFGWAKPVPFNPRNLGNLRRDPVLIAIAGPISNIILAVVFTLILRVIFVLASAQIVDVSSIVIIAQITQSMIMINLLLAIFNCIPVPPLDGHYLVRYFLPPHIEEQFERIGPFLFIGMILFARDIISGPMHFFSKIVTTFVEHGVSGFFGG